MLLGPWYIHFTGCHVGSFSLFVIYAWLSMQQYIFLGTHGIQKPICYADELYSGIANDRVLTVELYS